MLQAIRERISWRERAGRRESQLPLRVLAVHLGWRLWIRCSILAYSPQRGKHCSKRMFPCSGTAPADFYARPSSRALVRRAEQLVTPGRPARASGLLLQHAEHDLPRRFRQQHRRRAHRLHLLQLYHRLQLLHRADRVQRERE